MEKVYNDIETLLENLGEKYDNNKKSWRNRINAKSWWNCCFNT
jgi:hypothetical protein